MQTIYTHISQNPQHAYFDPDHLKQSARETLGAFDKPTYGLWASPFNIPNICEWEDYFASELNPNAYKRTKALYQKESNRFKSYLQSLGLTRDQFNSLPQAKKYVMQQYYDQLPPAYTSEEMHFALEKDKDDYTIDGVNNRKNAFYFVVDQSRILHVHSAGEIFPYLQSTNSFGMQTGLRNINFDRIKADGYDGLELHNAAQLRSCPAFFTWDVDSIVIWNPDCVTQIDKNIAYLARFSAAIQTKYDKLDPDMSGIRLVNWVVTHEDAVRDAIRNNIISFDDVERAIGRVYDLEKVYQEAPGISLTEEYAHLVDQTAQEPVDIDRT
jgi:hypothetical protein